MEITGVRLQALLAGAETVKVAGETERLIGAIRYDSRAVRSGDLFVAVRGFQTDGHAFIGAALASGASAIVLERDGALEDGEARKRGVVKILVRDSRAALAALANAFYGYPTKDILLVGVTGTNGKTTTTHVVRHLLEQNGTPAGLIGTIESRFGATVFPMEHTTPESVEVCGLIAAMKERGARAVVMEVSSHALALHRVDGLEFDAAAFTNLTQDHLDFHRTMDEYAEAKALLFRMLPASAVAVVNADDAYSAVMERGARARIVRYALERGADFRAVNIALGPVETKFDVEKGNTRLALVSPYIGVFNVYNVLCGVAVASMAGIGDAALVRSVATLPAVRGRLERTALPNGAIAVVDYAHTPDALKRAIAAVRAIVRERGGRIVTMFGCGGDRDAAKRPLMGEIAARLSDIVVVTSDNPRSEDPQAIIADILRGISQPRNVKVIADRGDAIAAALDEAAPADAVLLAGKGHEDYQIIGGTKVHFDDLERVRAWVARKNATQSGH